MTSETTISRVQGRATPEVRNRETAIRSTLRAVMRAVQALEFGGPDVLTIVEVPVQHPGPGQIRVAVAAVAVNPFDCEWRKGGYDILLPRTIASDVAGVVAAIGDGVDNVVVGDAVFGAAVAGGASDFALLQSWAHKPTALSDNEAACFVTPAETAVRALDLLGVDRGTRLVVDGASGGVGSAATQIAVSRGAHVVSTSSRANLEFLAKLGATPVEYGDGMGDRAGQVLTEIDAVLDIAGKTNIHDLIAMVERPDRVVSIANFDAPTHGARVTDGSEGRAWQGLRTAADLFVQGAFRMEIAEVFGLEQAGLAHAACEARSTRGKIVVNLSLES